MRLEGNYTFDAPVQVVWNTLLNPDTIAACMPGKESFTQIGPDHYEAAMKIKVGPISGSATGRIKLLEQNEPHSYRMDVDGGGGIGHMAGGGTLTLIDRSGKTVVSYEGEAQVTGKVASVGQRLLGVSAKLMIGQFFKCMESKLPGGQ